MTRRAGLGQMTIALALACAMVASGAGAQPGASPPVLSERQRQALDREAELGVGQVSKAQPVPAAPGPRCVQQGMTTREDGTLVTMSRQAHRELVAAEQARCAEVYAAHAREQNARTAARLQQLHEDAVARCGGPLPVLPRLGMTRAEVFGCTQAGHFPAVQQHIEFTREGRQLQLYVLGRADLARLYFVDGVLARMDR